MHETKREGYIRRIENALKSDTTKITNAIIFSEEATREILELLKEQPKRTEKRTETHACDCISREDVEQMVEDNILCYTHSDRPIDQDPDTECHMVIRIALGMLRKDLRKLPSAQPDYQDVLGWLLAYHTMSFDLHGRYLPHEVISWLINDFTREFIAVREQDE